jgi:hypothetical protein
MWPLLTVATTISVAANAPVVIAIDRDKASVLFSVIGCLLKGC